MQICEFIRERRSFDPPTRDAMDRALLGLNLF